MKFQLTKRQAWLLDHISDSGMSLDDLVRYHEDAHSREETVKILRELDQQELIDSMVVQLKPGKSERQFYITQFGRKVLRQYKEVKKAHGHKAYGSKPKEPQLIEGTKGYHDLHKTEKEGSPAPPRRKRGRPLGYHPPKKLENVPKKRGRPPGKKVDAMDTLFDALRRLKKEGYEVSISIGVQKLKREANR